MVLRRYKNYFGLALFPALPWICLLLACFWLCAPRVAGAAPYSARGAFYADGDGAVLAVLVTPEKEGTYLYASKGQATGKVTELTAHVRGTPLGGTVLFPRGVEKPDPLNPGGMTRVFVGPLYILVPVERPDMAGEDVEVNLTGLTCSAVNCTPVAISLRVPLPDGRPADPLPEPAREILRSGVSTPMPALAAARGEGATPSFGATPGVLGGVARLGDVAGVFAAEEPGAFLETLTPASFTPGLEVASFGKAAFLGFLAGIVLNLMPCVLPVIGIKLGALLRGGADERETRRRFRRHQVFFAFGILTWFTAMAVIFHYLGLAWGQIFQSPAVVLVLAVLLLLLALNLFGALSLPLIDFRMGNPKNPDMQAFAGGFTATLLATPCGGPLLGGVLSWALMQPFGVLTLTLECVGLGMAFPYLLLGAFPALAERIPRPGRWMGVLEHVLAFLLLGTVAYLVSFLPGDILPRAVAALVLAGFGGWLWGKGKTAAKLFGAACIVLACVWPLMERPVGTTWREYTHGTFRSDLGERMILVDFTADWCPTCKMVEATALTEDAVREWEKAYNLALYRVDMTRPNPEGEALLRAVGSVSIPVIAIFGKNEKARSPLVLRDVVTRAQVAAALKRAATSK